MNQRWDAPAPPRPGRHARLVPLLVPLLVVALAGIGWLGTRLATDDSVEWDANVEPLADFVEEERRLEFDHPVELEFLTDDEWDERVRTEESELTDEDRQDIEESTALLRALGLADGDLDLLEEQNDLSTDAFVAFYDPETERITVHADNSNELSVEARGTIVHELTHALQDQHFDIEALQDDSDPDAEFAVRSLIEGDASNVESEWVEELSAADQDEYFADDTEDPAEDAPDVLAVQAAAPYAFGPSFALMLDDAGELDDTYRDLPTTDEHVFDPASFLSGDEPEDVDVPELPKGATEIDDGEFGVLGLFTVLAERLDPHVALAAVNGWGGDGYRSYEDDGKVCVGIDVRGETNDDTKRIAQAFDDWIASLPEEFASADSDGRLAHLESCDPGADFELTSGASYDALVVPVARASIEVAFMGEGLPAEVSRCAATRVTEVLTPEELASEDSARFETEEFRLQVQAFVRECGGA